MITKVWEVRSKRDGSVSTFVATEKDANAYTGTTNRYYYDINEVERDVVFLVMEEGEHYDGGDTITAITETLTLALTILAKQRVLYPQADFGIEVREVLR
jgi:hypothetical protein